MSATPKSKKPRTRAPKSRPQSTSAISQPAVDTDIVTQNADSNVIKDKHVTAQGASNKRYAEPSSLEVRSGVELGQDPSADDLMLRDIDGHLDVDLAELSLGQRLTALSGDATGMIAGSSESDSDERNPQGHKIKSKSQEVVVPASSLTRTLIQALHSSDSRLLETCLTHSDPTLIQNTVRKLPPQLAVPLLTACIERLGRGPRAGNMKGGGGGASSQRGTGLNTWIKTVLTVHGGHLMTMPDLVARLSSLHATLTSRLALQESLLSLSGRLDMVLSHIELRSSNAPASLADMSKSKTKTPKNAVVERYVEGESDEEDGMEVEVEHDDDGGSVEDIEFGKDQDESDEDEAGTSDDDSEEDSEDEEGPTLNGFIDDEAEEFDEDEDDDGSE